MIMLFVTQFQQFKFCIPYRLKTNLELDLKLDVQKTMHSLYFNQIDCYCGTEKKNVLFV